MGTPELMHMRLKTVISVLFDLDFDRTWLHSQPCDDHSINYDMT